MSNKWIQNDDDLISQTILDDFSLIFIEKPPEIVKLCLCEICLLAYLLHAVC